MAVSELWSIAAAEYALEADVAYNALFASLHCVLFNTGAAHVDYDSLRIFLNLSRTLHYGRASRESHRSPSAVSRLIARLEAEVGHPLIERDNKRVRLTPQGEQFARFADDALARYAEMHAALVRDTATLHGTLSIFASVTACQSFLPALLTRFREAHPEVQLALETGYAVDALEMLERGAVDVTVAALPEKLPKQLASRVVVVTPLVFVAPSAACDVSRRVERKPIVWDELPLVLPAHGLARDAVDRWLRVRKAKANIYSEVAGNEAILALVSTGCGVGVVPKLVMDRSPLRNDVRALEIEPKLGEFKVGVCTPRAALSNPLIGAFWAATA
jgi:LysR family positive regulator for ilvC